jgi:hypothetical protein
MNSPAEVIGGFSSLTRIQLETLEIHRDVLKGIINMDMALKKRKDSGISRGTHYRILAQGRKNVIESVFTVAVAVKLGLVKLEDVQKLVSTVVMIPADIDQEKLSEVVSLIKTLADRIVML